MDRTNLKVCFVNAGHGLGVCLFVCLTVANVADLPKWIVWSGLFLDMKSTYSPTAEPSWFHILSILTIAWPSVLISLQLSGKTLLKNIVCLGFFRKPIQWMVAVNTMSMTEREKATTRNAILEKATTSTCVSMLSTLGTSQKHCWIFLDWIIRNI